MMALNPAHVVAATAVLADASGGIPTSIEGAFLQFGVVGAVALGLTIYARATTKATEERARRFEDDNRRLYTLMADQIMPALTRASDTIVNASSIITEFQRREEQRTAIEAARRQGGTL